MATYFCPGCGKGLRYEDRESGYCPGCGKPLPASVALSERLRPEGPPRAAGDEPPRRSAAAEMREVSRQTVRSELLAWGTVRASLALTVVGGIMTGAGLGISLLLMVSDMSTVERGHNALDAVAQWVLVFLTGLGFCMVLCGVYMASAAPPDSGSKGAAIAACGALSLTLLLIPVNYLVGQEQRRLPDVVRLEPMSPRVLRPTASSFPEGEQKALEYAHLFLGLIAAVCYCLFLRGVARFFNRDGLAAGILAFLLVGLVYTIGMTAYRLSEALISDTMKWVLLGSIVALLVWFLVLVGLVRSAVTQGLLKAS